MVPSGTAAQAPTVTSTLVSFTSTGPGTWSVPSGVSEVEVLIVAGGGGGGGGNPSADGNGGGGAGGIVYAQRFPVTPGGTVS